MKFLKNFLHPKLLTLLLFWLLALLGAGLLLTLFYSLKSDFRVAVGEFGDAPFISGFNSDEAGAPRYRWSTGSSQIIMPLAPNPNAPNKLRLELGAAFTKDSKIPPPAVTVIVNGVELSDKAQTAEGVVKQFEFDLPQAALRGDNLQIELRTPTFKAAGDPRTLGVKVQAVRWQTAPALRLPPLDVLFWAWLFVIAIAVLVASPLSIVSSQGKVEGREQGSEVEDVKSTIYNRQSAIEPTQSSALSHQSLKSSIVNRQSSIALVVLLPILLIPLILPSNTNLWYTPSYLPLVAGLVWLIALLRWRRVVGRWLWEFPARLEQGKLARNILIVASVFYMAYSLSVIAQMDFVGHADYADNAVAARNIVRGNGYSLDYAAQFYNKYNLPRPADTWPMLQPLITVPFFAVFGVSAFTAKLPNWLLMLALTWVVYYYGARYFNRKTALGAALLVLTEPLLFETVAYPINDLSFTLFSFLAIFSAYTAATLKGRRQKTEGRNLVASPVSVASSQGEAEGREQGSGVEDVKSTIYNRQSAIEPTQSSVLKIVKRQWLLAGVWGGLLILSKPSGAVILVGIGLWLLWLKFRRQKLRLKWADLILWGIVVLLVASPYFIRNQLQFGKPLYTTESYDAWLLKWYPPDERIYDLYYPTNKSLPDQKQLLVYGFDTIFKAVYDQFRKEVSDFFSGRFIAPLLWALAAIGVFGLRRRRYNLLGLITLTFVIYLLFINIYWHYELRYFIVWLPWFNLFGIYGLGWLYDSTRRNNSVQINATKPKIAYANGLAGWLVAGAFLVLTLPNLPTILDPTYTNRTGIVLTAEWLRDNTPRDAVIMSRNVWELSFHSERRSVMFPNNATLDEMAVIMRDYGVTYLQFDHLDPDDPQWRTRPALWPFLQRKEMPGYKLVYDLNGLIVYAVLK